MKNHYFLVKGWCLVVTLLMTIPFMGQATETSRLFKARRQTNLVRSFSTQLTHSDTIPLQNMSAIYALSIDATITQPREASFVRIVLEDTEGHDYLVAESDRFRNDTALVQLTAYCEETARLDGVAPVRLKCYLAGDATLQLTSYHVSDQEPTRGQTANEETDAAIKEAQVQNIVNRINEYNIRHGKLWQAGATSYALRHLEQQQLNNEEDAYFANMKYYVDGLYEIGERTMNAPATQSTFVDSFDWRNRHGMNWITSVKDQIDNGPCSIFAAVGVAEALTNIYFNDSTINRDLSEYFIYGYKYNFIDQNILDYIEPLEFLVTDSVIDESSCPYLVPFSYNDPRPYGQESIRLSGIKRILKAGLSDDAFSDSLKYHLIHYGPGVWGGQFPNNNNYMNHYMTLVGYGTAHTGQTYTVITNNSSGNMTIPSTMDGKTYWIFKNSFGNSQAQYMNIIFNDPTKYYDACFAFTPIISRQLKNKKPKCMDRDGDGYYYWGISENPPTSLPSWAHREKDADDSNYTIGPMDDGGNPTMIDADGWVYISNFTTVNKDSFNYKHIVVQNGGTLVIKKHFSCHPGICVYVQSGGTLTIDSGVLENCYIDISSNATINLLNGGRLVLLPMYDELFSLPQTAKLNLIEGSIQKSGILWNY